MGGSMCHSDFFDSLGWHTMCILCLYMLLKVFCTSSIDQESHRGTLVQSRVQALLPLVPLSDSPHSKSSEMWPGQMCRISLPMGHDSITCLLLQIEPSDHKAHCWRVPTHCIPWRPATSTRSGSRRSGMVVETVYETESVPNEQHQQH